MSAGNLIRRQDGWLTSWVGPELVMMSGAAGTYISLSETAGRVWELLETPQSLNDLCSTLAAEYDFDDETIRAQVVSFLRQMQAEGMVVADAACLV